MDYKIDLDSTLELIKKYGLEDTLQHILLNSDIQMVTPSAEELELISELAQVKNNNPIEERLLFKELFIRYYSNKPFQTHDIKKLRAFFKLAKMYSIHTWIDPQDLDTMYSYTIQDNNLIMQAETFWYNGDLYKYTQRLDMVRVRLDDFPVIDLIVEKNSYYLTANPNSNAFYNKKIIETATNIAELVQRNLLNRV